MKDGSTRDATPRWKRLGAMWSAEWAEHAHVPGYELTAFVLPADRAKGWDRQIGWEVHGGTELLGLIATGSAATFDDAKRQAEAAWHEAAHAVSHSPALRPEPGASNQLPRKHSLWRDPG